jgi:pyruvate,water dikinase
MLSEIMRFIRRMKNILLRSRKPAEEYPFAKLFKKFQSILSANNEALELIADMGDKLSGDYVFDRQYILSVYEQLKNQVHRLIFDFNTLAPGKYASLFNIFEGIHDTISQEISGKWVLPQGNAVIFYSALNHDMYELAGGKNANLAEVKNVLGLPTPDGFAITTSAFRSFLEKNGLYYYLQQVFEQDDSDNFSEEMAEDIQKRFLSGTFPPELIRQIEEAIDVLQQKHPEKKLFFAVRSSAWGEDSIHSFAGQYKSFLNVPADRISETYKKVLAGAYSLDALSYRQQKGFHLQELAMSVACQTMADAKVSGVIYTMDPLSPENETLTVTAAYGLGAPVVEGEVHTDHYAVSRTPPHKLCGFKVVRKTGMLVAAKKGGTKMEPVPEDMENKACLNPDDLRKLAETALLIERYFKRPQDIEWAMDHNSELMILQARPLNIRPQPGCSAGDIVREAADYPVLMRGKGIVVQRGVAAGKVFVVRQHEDLSEVPYGSILVAKHTSPRLARVMRKVHGIITDVGSPMGHLAAIAREFRVPTIVNTETATQIFKTDDEITMDASQNIVYAGNIKKLCYYEFTSEDVFEESYEYRLLRRILKKISPLNLVEPNDKNFKPSGCETLHDIIRFIHEKAVEELIHFGNTRISHSDSAARRLKFDIPLGLIVIDIGGGIHHSKVLEKEICPDDIASVPMQTFLDGLTAPGMWSTEPMSVDLGSFMSSLTRTSYSSSDAGFRYSGQNLAVISKEYFDLSMRLGYHFNIIDAYISENLNDNYAYFRFLGGVTDITRRSRRARFIAEVLERFNFRTEIRGDLVIGRIKKLDRVRMMEKMRLLGCLVAYTRQLDAQMHSDDYVGQYVNDFFQRRCSYDNGAENADFNS